MNFKYTIQDQVKPFIKITERELLSLQDLLNTLCVNESLEEIISELKAIQQKYPDLDELVDNKYNGYWEDDILGKSFTILGYDNGLDVYMHEDIVYIEDEYQYPTVPRVELRIEEFIHILEKWRDILKSYFKNQS